MWVESTIRSDVRERRRYPLKLSPLPAHECSAIGCSLAFVDGIALRLRYSAEKAVGPPH